MPEDNAAPPQTEIPEIPATPNISQEPTSMLDVHPPHEPVHTWRDFLLHLITIAIGLLIALSLEGLVEWHHHRHLVAEARETLREEMTENQKLIRHDMDILKQDEANLSHNIAILQQQKDYPSSNPEKLNMNWTWYGPLGAAWTTARDTGALALMPYSDVQRYSLVYLQQDNVDQDATYYLRLHNEAFAPTLKNHDLAKLSPTDYDKLIDSFTVVITQERYLGDLARGLDHNYTNALAIQ